MRTGDLIRCLRWKTALERGFSLGCSCKRGFPLGTAASLLKHGQTFGEIPISQPDDAEICFDASGTVSASAQPLQDHFAA